MQIEIYIIYENVSIVLMTFQLKKKTNKTKKEFKDTLDII